MIKYFFKPSEKQVLSSKIDLKEIYNYLNLNKASFPNELYEECILKIRDVLIAYTKPEVPFTKENIAYVKRKYSQYMRRGSEKRNSDDLGYFVYPNNDFMPESFLSKAYKANEEAGLKGIDLKNPKNNAEIQYSQVELERKAIHKWAYDIYSYSQSFITTFDQLAEDYELLIILYLIFLDPKYFNKGYLSVLFNKSASKELERTLDTLEMKYTHFLKIGNWDLRMKGFRNSEEGLIKSSSPEKQKTENKVDKVLKVHKKVIRGGGKINPNSLTLLDTKGSAFLFRFLADAKAIIRDNRLLSQRDLSKHLACMTGYNESNLSEYLSPRMVMNLESLEEILKVSDRLNMLIKSEIEKVKRRAPKKV